MARGRFFAWPWRNEACASSPGFGRSVDAVYRWNERKRAFTPRQIRLAWDLLDAKGWLKPTSPSGPST